MITIGRNKQSVKCTALLKVLARGVSALNKYLKSAGLVYVIGPNSNGGTCEKRRRQIKL